jgi:arylsulfatase A-like enzyme
MNLDRPNILLITIDSARWDHFSTCGYRRETTPYMDQLASEGTFFENAISPGNWTGASVTSILTGLYPSRHGYTNKRYFLDDDIESLPKILRQHGYHTICFSNNMYISSKTGLARDFDEFYYQGIQSNGDEGNKNSHRKSFVSRLAAPLNLRMRSILKDAYDSLSKQRALSRDDGANATIKAITKWLANYQTKTPFFMYIHFQEPHSIYFPPRPFRRRFFNGSWLDESKYLKFDHIGYYAGKVTFSQEQIQRYIDLYDGELAYVDFRIGQLVDVFRSKEMMNKTVFAITADHGDNFGENDHFWHAFCLYDQLIRVPFFVRYPDWFREGYRNPQLVQTHDLVPTLLAGLDIDWPYEDENQGQSFLSNHTREFAFTESFNPEKMIKRWLKRDIQFSEEDFIKYFKTLRSIRTLGDKFIWHSNGAHEYYDLNSDPYESNNLYQSSNSTIKERERALQVWLKSFEHHVAQVDEPGFDKDTWESLRNLGYA